MSLYVIDASVAVKWFAEEEMAPQAELLLDGQELLCLDHTVIEVASALRRKAVRGLHPAIDIAGDVETLQRFCELRLGIHLIYNAIAISFAYKTSVYDSLYVALAQQEQCRFVTADQRLYAALAGVYPDTLIWLGDVTPEML